MAWALAKRRQALPNNGLATLPTLTHGPPELPTLAEKVLLNLSNDSVLCDERAQIDSPIFTKKKVSFWSVYIIYAVIRDSVVVRIRAAVA